MSHPLIDVLVPAAQAAAATPVWFVDEASYAARRDALDAVARGFVDAAGFAPKAGRHLLVPAADGKLAGVLFGLPTPAKPDPFLPGRLPGVLPPGDYRFDGGLKDMRLGALAFALGAYRFERYRKSREKQARLVTPDSIDAADLARVIEGVALARDLINTPPNDMGPGELQDAAFTLAKRHGATARCTIGDRLMDENFPLIHAVGRAADATRAPRLIDLIWGDENHPKVTLVGKGVCFDTGGLDLKPSAAMLLMKKDMGGAASVLALAHMIMDGKLPVRLRVLIPAVENSVAGLAFRPSDVYPSHKGLTVEIGNTDAEGRLVLADALALADEEAPDLLVDMGTLTGAARVALGPDLPPFYTDDETLAADIATHAAQENDPLWRMPLWRSYDAMLDSKVADVNNVSSGAFAGSVTCALFLNRFVSAAKSWLHFDIYGWVPSAKAGRPEGGECQAARALYALLRSRYGEG